MVGLVYFFSPRSLSLRPRGRGSPAADPSLGGCRGRAQIDPRSPGECTWHVLRAPEGRGGHVGHFSVGAPEDDVCLR